MLFMFRAKLEKPAEMTNADFFGLWEKESEKAVELLEGGIIKTAFKVAGSHEVIAIVEVDTLDEIDNLVHSLPIYRLAKFDLVKDLTWTPLREYAGWYEDLKSLAVSGEPANPM